MSKDDFPAAEFSERLGRVRRAMAARNLDWLVAVHPVSILWLTGSEAKSYQEFQCLFVGANDEPLTVLVRAGEVNELEAESIADRVVGWGGGVSENPLDAFASLAQDLGLIGRRVGLEVPGAYLHPYHYLGLRDLLGPDRLVDATSLIADLKLVKSATELDYVRQAARMADDAMAAFHDELAAGKTELQLAGRIYETLLSRGSGIAASPINLVSGPRSAFSHGAPTTRVMRRGDFGNVEFGATCRRYTATLGRQFVLGEPSRRMVELYDVVRLASDAMLASIADGVAATAVHEAARQVIADAGLDRHRVHLSGYGLGPGFPPTWAEPLHFLDRSSYTLQAGMVVTVEPPVFVGEEGLGARLIDNVLVTATGHATLAQYRRELMVVS